MPTPRLAIGMPVYNGERYLSVAVESLLAQSDGNFTLLIADNASTDATPDICRDLARRDPRVSYTRHPQNIGAARNFNHVFHATRSHYFKWAAHDDLCDPTFLARCIEHLDADPGVVLCHTYSMSIDGRGLPLGPTPLDPAVTRASPGARFIASLRLGYPAMIWGVMRRDAAAATGLISSFVGSDRYFLGELLLLGRAELIPEFLFSVRRHDESFSGTFDRVSQRSRRGWFDPSMRLRGLTGMTSTTARLIRRFATDPIPICDRAACMVYVGRRLGGFLAHRAAESAALGIPRRAARPFARFSKVGR